MNVAGHLRVYKTKCGVASVSRPVQGGSEDDFGCVREQKARDFQELHTVIGRFLEILLLCYPFALLVVFPMYYHVLLSRVEPHVSSANVLDSENYPHHFDMLPVSFTTKGINLPQFQVFINFRGDELRNTFVGFLVKAMRLEKINVFTDEVEVRGTTLNSLFSRIEASKVAVAIFSDRYTESSWCLDELVKMNDQMQQGKLVVVPVFYKLDPSACANLDGTFGDKFRKLEWEYRSETDRIKKWKEALSSVSKIMGLKLDAGR
ncbi:unnamed protein product [Eruca vesicaria subsp. sativa]|uniref:TIR domain-containing protein n=1 Tax=Eruca vesicaria subsp. sativa TaxID=29727 RepID=A0ABC8J2K3_ERUVS|nr:unnamed protein product [Eruca vesicaria subsp. sativa]